MRPAFRSLVALALLAVLAAPAGAVRRPSAASVQSPNSYDLLRRFDVNELNMWMTNYGSFAWDLYTGNSGLEFPKGSGHTAVFAAGLWLGARVNGETRTVVAEYSQEFGPGAMVGGTFSDPALPQYHVYKVKPWTGNPADTAHVDRTSPGPLEDPLEHHGWSEYMAGAAPYGAPVRMWDLPDPNDANATIQVPGPDVAGDQMLWAVFNDADPANHTNDAGGSTPLGVEVQHAVTGVNQSGAPGQTAFARYRIINKGAQQLSDMYVSMWVDPDVGGATDDLVGSDPGLGMVYAYNANNADLVYGSSPPAVGAVLLEGPKNALGDTIPATSAVRYIDGTDPAARGETYAYMQGLNIDGTPQIDPTTNTVKTFVFDGDPTQGTGWLDANPADRRMMLSSGPFSMAPGDTQNVEFAIVLGQGTNRLASISALKANVNLLRSGTTGSPPPPPATNCPRPVAYWASQCPPSTGELTPAQLTSIATLAGTQSLLFDWAGGTEAASFCATLSPPGPVGLRTQAKTEFAALLANWAAGQLGIVPPSGSPIRLLEGMPVLCPGVTATTLGQLVQTGSPHPALDVTYENDDPTHRRALTGLNWGGASFFGGADFGWNFWGGSLNPATQRDSFATVEVRFSHTATQRAYRYLRLQMADGSSPAGGREYRYGGFHEVPFQVWDTVHDVQLDVAFVERTVTDAFGTIQPPGAQTATFDSTWAPDASFDGGREYLYLLNTPYSDTPKTPFEVDDALDVVPMPILYALWAAKRSTSDVIDDGDRMLFAFAPYSGPGADTQLLLLEDQSLTDPAVQLAYQQIIDCLRDINTGVSIENPCDQPTAVQLSLLSADANADRVELTWYTSSSALAVAVERRSEGGAWTPVAQTHADASGMIRYSDTDVAPGVRYDYRLTFLDDGVWRSAAETSIVVPARLALALSGFVPNPARDVATIEFVLPTRAPATLEVLDLQGRRLLSRDVGELGPGRASVTLDRHTRLAPGIYVVRLTQGTTSVSRKAVMVR